MDDRPLTDMVNHDPPRPHWSVGEVLGAGLIPDKLVGRLLARLRVTNEYGYSLSMEVCSRIGFHAFLGHIASRIDPFPGLYRFTLLAVDRD